VLIGLIGMILIILTIVGCWINFFIELFPNVVRMVRKKCKKKRRIHHENKKQSDICDGSAG